MKSPQRLPLLLVAILAAAITFAFIRQPAPPEAPAPPLVSLEKMGHLVSLKMNYADVIEFTQPNAVDIPWSQWEVRLGSTRVLLVARGDCTVATDLRQARYDDVDARARTMTVVLPPPAPLQARISHEARNRGGSYFYAVTDQGLQAFIPSAQTRTNAMNNALATAQKAVQAACKQPGVLDAAKENAAAVLQATLGATGWTPNVIWEARASASP
ncbi:DUF4230 domain-containing protein [Telluria beijingensis]|uniref:DUF4230 domain-containing protein n=1 Tax=Telluria beijingensis TaxID=3068633 RepID=UPI002795EE73|nr:DUF4230 domain-containing protein [Massilia sp. REN29]